MDPITTAVTSHGDVTVLAVGGAVDLATAALLEEAIDAALALGAAGLVIDLTEVDFLASVGMAMLVATQQRLGPQTTFAVVADSPATSRPLRITGLDQAIAIYPTLPDALATRAS